MFSRIFLLFLFLNIGLDDVYAESSYKIATLARVNFISDKLLEIANQRQSLANKGKIINDTKLVNDVKKLLQNESNPDVLVRVAIVSLQHMSPGNAEDQIIDNVFDEAWRGCIRRIETIGDQRAINALEDTVRPKPLDGGFSLLLREALQRLKHDKVR